MNIYGPYAERVPFWDGVSNSRILDAPNIILGNINFTLSIREVIRGSNFAQFSKCSE